MNKYLDKRFHPRKKLGQEAFAMEMGLPDRAEGENLRLVAQGLNISSGGAGFIVPHPLWEGDVVKINYPCDDNGTAIPIYSKVIWRKTSEANCRVGLQFLDRKVELKHTAFYKDFASRFERNDALNKGIAQAFPLLNEKEISVLKKHFKQKTLSAKEVLCDEGEKAEFAAIVLDGKICAMKNLDLGNKKIIIGVLGEGSILNGTALASNQRSFMSIVATEETKVLILSKSNFENITLTDPWLGIKILKSLMVDTHFKLNNAFKRITGFF